MTQNLQTNHKQQADDPVASDLDAQLDALLAKIDHNVHRLQAKNRPQDPPPTDETPKLESSFDWLKTLYFSTSIAWSMVVAQFFLFGVLVFYGVPAPLGTQTFTHLDRSLFVNASPIRVIFDHNATYQQIQTLLQQLQLAYDNGPDANGAVILRTTEQQQSPEKLLVQLRTIDIVQSAKLAR